MPFVFNENFCEQFQLEENYIFYIKYRNFSEYAQIFKVRFERVYLGGHKYIIHIFGYEVTNTNIEP